MAVRIMPEDHYANRLASKAEEVALAWMRGETDKVKLIFNGLSPMEAGMVMLMAYLGFNKYDQGNFSKSMGMIAVEIQQKTDMLSVNDSNPFAVEKIDTNEYALYVDQGERWASIMCVDALSTDEARYQFAQRLSNLVREAPDRARPK